MTVPAAAGTIGDAPRRQLDVQGRHAGATLDGPADTWQAEHAASVAPSAAGPDAAVMVLPDEPELGPQRRCVDCQAWWPDDAEFFVVWSHWRSPRCRACHEEQKLVRAARRIGGTIADAVVALRAQNTASCRERRRRSAA